MSDSRHEYDREDRKPGADEQAGYGCGASFNALDVEVFNINSAPVSDGIARTVASLPSSVSLGKRTDDKGDNKASRKCGKSLMVHASSVADHRSK